MRYENEVISQNIKRKQKIKKILIFFLYILLIPIILFSLFLMIAELGNSQDVPSSFNIELYTVTSESMSPRIKVNDIIVIKKGYKNEQYKIGNIITFKRSDGELITHRIVDVTTSNLVRAYITKGDNNAIEDKEIVKYDQIVGRVILTMPKLGSVIALLKNKAFFSLCIAFLILIIIYDKKNRNKILERKKVREKYEKKSDFYF